IFVYWFENNMVEGYRILYKEGSATTTAWQSRSRSFALQRLRSNSMIDHGKSAVRALPALPVALHNRAVSDVYYASAMSVLTLYLEDNLNDGSDKLESR